MTVNLELAGAARRVSALAARLPVEHRPDVSEEWAILLDSIDGERDSVAREQIAAWLAEFEERLAVGLVHAPLEAE